MNPLILSFGRLLGRSDSRSWCHELLEGAKIGMENPKYDGWTVTTLGPQPLARMPPRTPKRAPIPRELIAQAHAGSAQALWDVGHRLAPETASIEVLQLALKNLALGVDEKISAKDGIGAPSLTILGTTVQSSKTNPTLREIIIGELEHPATADSICHWVEYCLYIAVPFRGFVDLRQEGVAAIQQNAILLDSLINLDERVYRAFLSSPRFAKILIRIWVEDVKGTKELFIFLKDGYQCPAYSVWFTTIDKEEGRDVILNALLSDDRQMKKFASAMVRRAKQARDKITSSCHTPPAVVIQYFDALLEVLSILVPHSVHLRRRLVQVNYITEYSKILSNISTKIPDSELKGPCRPVITTVAKLAKLVDEQQDRVLRNWRDFIAGDFVSLITRIITVVPVHDDEYQNDAAYAMLHNLGAFTVYPMILHALPSVEGMQVLAKKLDGALGDRNPMLAKEWRLFCSGVIGRATIMRLNTFTQCDNSICKRFHLRTGTKASRQCARCSSVVYCSDECQREDWNRWHRTECFPAIPVHYERKSTDRWYTHADRWYQTKWIEATYNHDINSITQGVTKHYPGATWNQVLPVIDVSSTTLHLEMVDIRDPSNWWQRTRLGTVFPEDQEHMRPRTEQVIKNFRHLSLSPDMRLVEGIFPLGVRESVHLTVVLQFMNDRLGGMWKAIYSIPRYGSPTPEALKRIMGV